MEVNGTPETNYLNGIVNTFGNIVQVHLCERGNGAWETVSGKHNVFWDWVLERNKNDASWRLSAAEAPVRAVPRLGGLWSLPPRSRVSLEVWWRTFTPGRLVGSSTRVLWLH